MKRPSQKEANQSKEEQKSETDNEDTVHTLTLKLEPIKSIPTIPGASTPKKSNNQLRDWIASLVLSAGMATIVVGIVAGLGVLTFQALGFLRHGEWTSISFRTLYQYGPESFVRWIEWPESWFGLHTIINGWIGGSPLSLGLSIFGVFFGMFISWWSGGKLMGDN